MSGRFRIGCCAETDEPNWRWISSAPGSAPSSTGSNTPAGELSSDAIDWTFFSNIPQNALERAILRPRVSRYRACRGLAKAACADRFDLVVTHHPLVTCWTELFCRGRRPCPHVAFAFNFTRLPRGPRRALMRRAFATVDRFIVFSEFERSLYADYFRLPVERFEMLHWGVAEPPVATADVPATEAICAVGSQARDYATLLSAMRRRPQLRLILVATADSLRGLNVPANVTVRLKIPLAEAQAVIRGSRFMVLPLVNSQVPCGHVTMVTAMYCSRAIIATESSGIADYLMSGQNGLTVPPNDPTALAAAIQKLWDNPAQAANLGENGRQFALANCTESKTINFVRDLITRVKTTGRP
jgi:glycosyltransferase involved in cell wall biosynthesis